MSECDGTTEVKRGKINDKSQPDLLSVETLICRAVGEKESSGSYHDYRKCAEGV